MICILSGVGWEMRRSLSTALLAGEGITGEGERGRTDSEEKGLLNIFLTKVGVIRLDISVRLATKLRREAMNGRRRRTGKEQDQREE
jgi:hypothetical protein